MPQLFMQEISKARLQRIERNLVSIANIIGRDGDKYWGIYEKLEAERKSLKRKRKFLRLKDGFK